MKPAEPPHLRLPEFPILLYDGACGFCQRSVVFVLAHERQPLLRFAAQNSETGRRLMEEFPAHRQGGESVILLEEGRAYWGSTAALRICRYLRGPWRYLRFLLVIPRPVRDALYCFIARHRHRLMSADAACLWPGATNSARFLDDSDGAASFGGSQPG